MPIIKITDPSNNLGYVVTILLSEGKDVTEYIALRIPLTIRITPNNISNGGIRRINWPNGQTF